MKSNLLFELFGITFDNVGGREYLQFLAEDTIEVITEVDEVIGRSFS